MKYLSTRGHADRKQFCDILLEGLAPDGGLYLPEHYPQVDDAMLTRLRKAYTSKAMQSWRSRSCRCTSTTFPLPT